MSKPTGFKNLSNQQKKKALIMEEDLHMIHGCFFWKECECDTTGAVGLNEFYILPGDTVAHLAENRTSHITVFPVLSACCGLKITNTMPSTAGWPLLGSCPIWSHTTSCFLVKGGKRK